MALLAGADGSAPIRIDGVTGFEGLRGRQLPATPWLDLTLEHVRRFASCTGDGQAIHVDPEVARKWGFSGPIVQGLLFLSTMQSLWQSSVHVDGPAALLYGINRVRFPAPVIVPTRVRALFEVSAVDEIIDGCQIKIDAAIEAEGKNRPVCTAEFIVRYLCHEA